MIEKDYNPDAIEARLQDVWENKELYKASEDFSREKFYCLAMLPYPSGSLHVGHVRNYTLSDVIARYQMMLGKNVLQPAAWDAFGLPAENAAIKHKVAPAKWTYENIEKMRSQFKRLGLAYDWSREFATCDPNYYRWEQWLFIKMYEKGLVYRKNSMVNWDPVDETVLANEQVIDGKGWRSDAPIERREIPQWFFKITDYADQLLDGLEEIDWPDQVKTMQRNWVGRSQGAKIQFEIDKHEKLEVFTTAADTLYGVGFLTIATQHPIALQLAKENKTIQTFIDGCKNIKVAEADISTMEKEGVDTGLHATNPLSGEKIPVWIANYVLMEYGTGVVMGVPAHDQRDFEFAKKYNLPIPQVIEADGWDFSKAAYTGTGNLINSGDFNGLDNTLARTKITDALTTKNAGELTTQYRLRDWGISRQRYWGAPIPFIHCDDCGIVPEKIENLPVVLPEDVELSSGKSTLKSIPEFYETSCPKCGKKAHRETDTFDTFMESSWYYARLSCKGQDEAILDDRAKYWTPVDQYVGGIEHACMHLLYARFIHKVLRDFGFVNSDEPFKKLLTQGMVLKDGAKMSKSKGNTVAPEALIEKYGVDTLRFFTIFTAPPEQSLEWSDTGVDGSHRFLNRLWAFAHEHQSALHEECVAFKSGTESNINWDNVIPAQRDAWREINSLLKQASYDMDRLQLNTVASSCMKLLNVLQKIPSIAKDCEGKEPCLTVHDYLLYKGTSILLRVLNPIAPHIAQFLWKMLGYTAAHGKMTWPKVTQQALKTDKIELVIQVNGKLRGKISVAANAEKESIEQSAQQEINVKKFISDKVDKKIIVVPNKLVNIVIGN